MPSPVFKKEGYEISDLDTAGATKYYGFLDQYGNWYIIQATDTTFRYIRGDSQINPYPDNWTNRGSLSYDLFNNIFNVA